MTAKRANLARSALLLAVTALVLPGCSGVDLQDYNPWTVGEWRQINDRPINHVDLVAMEHIVAFRPSAIRLDQAELSRLRYFVETSRAQSSDQIMVHAPRRVEGLDDQVTRARLEILRQEFLNLGLQASISYRPAANLSNSPDQVAVVVSRAVAIVPDCTASDPVGQGVRPQWTVGCSVNASLGLMAADPRDLVRGRAVAPADGEVLSKAVEGYRDPAKAQERPNTLTLEFTSGN